MVDQLMKDYNILKKQCHEYDEIISEHKKKYKNVEGKINEIKQSIGIWFKYINIIKYKYLLIFINILKMLKKINLYFSVIYWDQ